MCMCISSLTFKRITLGKTKISHVLLCFDLSLSTSIYSITILINAIIRPINNVDALKAHVEAIVPVIELPAGKLEPTQPMVALDLAAANVLSANYIVGRRNPVAKVNPNRASIRLARRLAKGDDEKNKTTGAAAHRGQWQNLLHQVNHVLGQGREIQPGHLILTGALGKITPAEPGDWTADFGELGKVEFSIH